MYFLFWNRTNGANSINRIIEKNIYNSYKF